MSTAPLQKLLQFWCVTLCSGNLRTAILRVREKTSCSGNASADSQAGSYFIFLIQQKHSPKIHCSRQFQMEGCRNECAGRLKYKTKTSSLPLCLAVAAIVTSEGSVAHIVKQYFQCFNCIFFILSCSEECIYCVPTVRHNLEQSIL